MSRRNTASIVRDPTRRKWCTSPFICLEPHGHSLVFRSKYRLSTKLYDLDPHTQRCGRNTTIPGSLRRRSCGRLAIRATKPKCAAQAASRARRAQHRDTSAAIVFPTGRGDQRARRTRGLSNSKTRPETSRKRAGRPARKHRQRCLPYPLLTNRVLLPPVQMGLLVAARQATGRAGGRVILATPSYAAAKTLRVSGLAGSFPAYATRAAALRAATEPQTAPLSTQP